MKIYEHSWNIGKNRNSHKRKNRYKEQANKNLRTKNIITTKFFRTHLEESRGKEKISKLEDTSIKIIQSEQQREDRLKQMDRTSRMCLRKKKQSYL